MKSGTPSPSASSITLSLMHEHRSRTNWSMFVFKLHTFDKRLLKVEAASFCFCQRAKLDKKWEMLSFNSSFYYTLWVWLSQCCWSWQLLCQHFHNGVHYFLKWSSLVFIIYGISRGNHDVPKNLIRLGKIQVPWQKIRQKLLYKGIIMGRFRRLP